MKGASAAPRGATAVGAGRAVGMEQQAGPVSMPTLKTHASDSTVEAASGAGKDLREEADVKKKIPDILSVPGAPEIKLTCYLMKFWEWTV